MLHNELKDIEEQLPDQTGKFPSSYSDVEFRERVMRVREAWLNAVFSEKPKGSLERYFLFHLEGISKISDTLFELSCPEAKSIKEEMLDLIVHLRDFYYQLISWETIAPAAYHQYHLDRLNPVLSIVRAQLSRPEVHPLLKKAIESWLTGISAVRGRQRFTFRNLFYMEKLVRALASLDCKAEFLSDSIVSVLYHSNFNHLSFLKYLQSSICEIATSCVGQKEEAMFFRLKEAEFSSIPLEQGCAFDDFWPTIKVMITDWLKERVKFSESASQKTQEDIKNLYPAKLGMKISVSYMACLIKLFYEEELFATENLTSIFKFYASNFTSKRQPVISQDSLSKEYYSLDAHTAARIKKILQNMIDRLNRGFFP